MRCNGFERQLFEMTHSLVSCICFFSYFFPFLSHKPHTPKTGVDGQKRKKSLRRKLDSLAKEKSKDKGNVVNCA